MDKFATIPGFKKMSKQRIFNLAVAHIAKTRKPSVDPSNRSCVYAGSGCNAAPPAETQHSQGNGLSG